MARSRTERSSPSVVSAHRPMNDLYVGTSRTLPTTVCGPCWSFWAGEKANLPTPAASVEPAERRHQLAVGQRAVEPDDDLLARLAQGRRRLGDHVPQLRLAEHLGERPLLLVLPQDQQARKPAGRPARGRRSRPAAAPSGPIMPPESQPESRSTWAMSSWLMRTIIGRNWNALGSAGSTAGCAGSTKSKAQMTEAGTNQERIRQKAGESDRHRQSPTDAVGVIPSLPRALFL